MTNTSSSSSSAAGCSRNSTVSIDSGRDSFRGSTTTTSSFGVPVAVSSYPIRAQQHLGGPSLAGVRQNQSHSSSSSLGSIEARGVELDSICALNVQEMMSNGVPDFEVLNAWLTDLSFEEYFDLFASAGYDMPTISRMTPEDLTAIGIQKPNHRKRIKSEIAKLNIGDCLPICVPNTLDEWLAHMRLTEYAQHLKSQGYLTVQEIMQISVEDLEDVGIFKLGHQKRFLLGIKRLKELKSGRFSDRINISNTPRRNCSSPLRSKQQGFGSFAPLSSAQGQSAPFSQSKTRNAGLLSAQPPLIPQQPIYEPDVIQIARSPTHSLSSPEPPPPPAPAPAPASTRLQNQHGVLETGLNADVKGGCFSPIMPQPMRPLSAFSRYTTSFQHLPQQHHHLFLQTGLESGHTQQKTTVDDSAVDIFAREHLLQSSPFSSLSSQTLSGGTLPRPKGLVKPIPVAKVTGNSRDNSFNGKDDLANSQLVSICRTCCNESNGVSN